MALNPAAPWHRESFETFIKEKLPQLLADRLPLAGYHLESTGTYTWALKLVLKGEAGEIELVYPDLPQPDQDGVFLVEGNYRVVVPVPSQPELETAQIRCVGEQLYDFFAAHLGEAPGSLSWDAALARAWLPIDAWMREFHHTDTSQYLQTTNWLDRLTHLRRLSLITILPHPLSSEEVITPGQMGRICPFCTPEGPNIGRVLDIAVGAQIRQGRLVIADGRPEGALGLSASMVPFLEHDDANRLLMGVNMMRQWMAPPDPALPAHSSGWLADHHNRLRQGQGPMPEPALVQTGNEPDAPNFWGGYNLLTAFITWDGDAFEDALVLSASAAKRLNYPFPVEPGDKISNRHGTKGVVSRILPDIDMPQMADGTPVELIYSLCGLPSRMNFGQVREALMGRIARAEGKPAVVPPFYAPDEGELRQRLKQTGLPESGMEILSLKGKPLSHPSTVGWVYWGRTFHVAQDKIRAATHPDRCQRHGDNDCRALREAGALATVGEFFNTLSAGREEAAGLAARVEAGPITPAGPPSPLFTGLIQRLAKAGIRAELKGGELSFGFAPPAGPVLRLARPLPHPWLPQRELTQVGAAEELPEYQALAQGNARLERLLGSQAPEPLIEKARAQLEARVGAFFDALLGPAQLRFDGQVLFSGWAVITPGADLRTDQVGLAEEIAWTLFGPLVSRQLGSREEVKRRSTRATEALDQLMALSWVIVFRAPATGPTAHLAFHPVRRPERVIRLHPLACELLDADFDGDLAAVFLPLTEEAQREAGARLSLAGHLARDPGLIRSLGPRMDAVFGLASLSRSSAGHAEVERLAGTEVATEGEIITRRTLIDALRTVLERDGIPQALEASERLMRRGFEIARASGASMSPFMGESLDHPPAPEGDDAVQWEAYSEEVLAWLHGFRDFDHLDFGPVWLMSRSGARAIAQQLVQFLGAFGTVPDVCGQMVPMRHGWREGLTPEEVYARVPGARRGLAQALLEMDERGRAHQRVSAGFGVLARARRSWHPGVVLARAAAQDETDLLTDMDSRLFVGLPGGVQTTSI